MQASTPTKRTKSFPAIVGTLSWISGSTRGAPTRDARPEAGNRRNGPGAAASIRGRMATKAAVSRRTPWTDSSSGSDERRA